MLDQLRGRGDARPEYFLPVAHGVDKGMRLMLFVGRVRGGVLSIFCSKLSQFG